MFYGGYETPISLSSEPLAFSCDRIPVPKHPETSPEVVAKKSEPKFSAITVVWLQREKLNSKPRLPPSASSKQRPPVRTPLSTVNSSRPPAGCSSFQVYSPTRGEELLGWLLGFDGAAGCDKPWSPGETRVSFGALSMLLCWFCVFLGLIGC